MHACSISMILKIIPISLVETHHCQNSFHFDELILIHEEECIYSNCTIEYYLSVFWTLIKLNNTPTIL